MGQHRIFPAGLPGKRPRIRDLRAKINRRAGWHTSHIQSITKTSYSSKEDNSTKSRSPIKGASPHLAHIPLNSRVQNHSSPLRITHFFIQSGRDSFNRNTSTCVAFIQHLRHLSIPNSKLVKTIYTAKINPPGYDRFRTN